MGSRALRASAAVLGVLLLAGCVAPFPMAGPLSGDMLSKIGSIKGGECFLWGDSWGGEVVDLTAPVPCTEVHDIEILRAVKLPEPLAGLPFGDAWEASMPGGAVFEYAMPLCMEALADWTGLTERIGRLQGLDGGIGLAPGVSGNVVLIPAPETVWDAYPAVFCDYEQIDELGEVVSVASTTDQPVVASFGRADSPAALGQCLIYEETSRRLADCDLPHHAEVLFDFDAELKFGTEWVAALDPFQPSDAAWAEMDEVCAIAAPAVFGVERTRDDLIIQADLLGGLWFRAKLPEDFAYFTPYPVSCLAVVTDVAALLSGTVWDLGDAPAGLTCL